MGHILFLEFQKRIGITLYPAIPTHGAGVGWFLLRHVSFLGRNGYPNKIKILLRRKEEGSLGRQPAMFTTQEILVSVIRSLSFSLITWEAV